MYLCLSLHVKSNHVHIRYKVIIKKKKKLIIIIIYIIITLP